MAIGLGNHIAPAMERVVRSVSRTIVSQLVIRSYVVMSELKAEVYTIEGKKA
ncbi:hypothetical protein GCM10028809_13050 [Spirosoma gilvum]